VEDLVARTFSPPDGPSGLIIYVGQRPEYVTRVTLPPPFADPDRLGKRAVSVSVSDQSPHLSLSCPAVSTFPFRFSPLISYRHLFPRWRTEANVFRSAPWRIQSIPTIVKLKDVRAFIFISGISSPGTRFLVPALWSHRCSLVMIICRLWSLDDWSRTRSSAISPRWLNRPLPPHQ